MLEAFTRGADEDVAKELEALSAAGRSGAAAQVDEALTDTDDDPAGAAVTGELVEQAELIRDKLVKAGVLIQSNTGTVVYRPQGPVAIGSDADRDRQVEGQRGRVVRRPAGPLTTGPEQPAAAGGAEAGVTATGPGAIVVGRMDVGRDLVYGDKIVHRAGRPRKVSWPVRIGQVPDVAAQFQHRPGVDLAARFAAAGQVGTVTLVSAGLGGTGKTQLAAHYARSVAGRVDLRVWVTAASRAGVVTGYAAAAAVGMAATGVDEQAAAEAFLSWLERTKKSWLVVLDDLDDPADLDGWWPTGRSGQVVVTTRRRDAELADHGGVVEVDVFDPEEARAYLTARLVAWQCDDIAGVAADLGFLPLALGQAISYMLHRGGGGLRCSQYRARLADEAARLEVMLPSDARAGGYRSQDSVRAAVATTWSLSIEAADALPPSGAARAVLVVASLLNPNGIPLELFTTASGVLACRDLTGGVSRLAGEDLLDALDHLARFSLADLNTDSAGQRWVRVHALVQRAVREALPDGDIQALAWTLADGLQELWPQEDHRVDVAEYLVRLRGNLVALRGVARSGLFHRDAEGVHPVLFAAVGSLRAQPHQAVDQARAFALDCERLLGSEHPDTLASRIILANAYQAAGRLAEAVPLLEASLADRERGAGRRPPGHPDRPDQSCPRLSDRRAAGRGGAAVRGHRDPLRAGARPRPPAHPVQPAQPCRHNLADAYQAVGRLAEAVPLFEASLTDRERVLGVDHPDTLTSRITLALAYQAIGRLAEAVPLFEATVTDCERLLGPDHPDTLVSRHALALAYRAVGRLADAIPLQDADGTG